MTSILPTMVVIERMLDTMMMSSVCSKFICSSPPDSLSIEPNDVDVDDDEVAGREMTEAAATVAASAKAEAEAKVPSGSSLACQANDGSEVNRADDASDEASDDDAAKDDTLLLPVSAKSDDT